MPMSIFFSNFTFTLSQGLSSISRITINQKRKEGTHEKRDKQNNTVKQHRKTTLSAHAAI